MTQSWKDDLAKAQEIFNKEFFTSAFEALSKKMKQEGGLNLTALSESMAGLSAQIEQRIAEHSKEVEQQAGELCDSLDEMAEQEKDVLKKIPELKNYRVFTI